MASSPGGPRGRAAGGHLSGAGDSGISPGQGTHPSNLAKALPASRSPAARGASGVGGGKWLDVGERCPAKAPILDAGAPSIRPG